MGFRVDRAIGGPSSKQLGSDDIKTSPMLRGRAIGGPRDKIILEAPRKWDGIIIETVRTKFGMKQMKAAGYYRWNGFTWFWEEVLDGDPIRQSSEESGKWGYF